MSCNSSTPAPADASGRHEPDLNALAVRVLHDYRRRDGLTSYVYEDSRKRHEAYMQAAFEAIVRPALASLSTPPRPIDMGEIERALEAAQFLIDRIDGWIDWSRDADEMANNWNGHVDPALSRARQALAAIKGEGAWIEENADA